MKNLKYLVLIIAAIIYISGTSYGVTAQFQVGVTIVAPPVTMDSQEYFVRPEFNAPLVAQSEAPAQEYVWEVRKDNIADGILLTYLVK